MSILAAILSVSLGSRLWPISREHYLKPVTKLEDGQSLLQKAFLRADPITSIDEIMTVASRELIYLTIDEYRNLKCSRKKKSFILEPFGRNTALITAAAALELARKNRNNDLVLVLPTDHLISNEIAFKDAIQINLRSADKW